MRDIPSLLWIAGGAVIALVAVGYIIAAAVKAADDLADDIPDWDRLLDYSGFIPGGPTNTTGADAVHLLHDRGDIR